MRVASVAPSPLEQDAPPPGRASGVARWLTVPMALTLLRLALLPIFLLLLWSVPHAPLHRRAAILVLVVMAITDVLDGYLARRLGQVTFLGTLLDPVADKLLLSASLLILALPRYAHAGLAFIPWPVTLGAYLKDFGVILGALVVRKKLRSVRLRARWPGKLSTTAQLSLVLATLLGPDLVNPVGPAAAGALLWGLWWAVTIAAAAAGMTYAYEGALQLRGESSMQRSTSNIQHSTFK